MPIDWTSIIPLVVPIVAGGIRSVAGWLENSLKDGKIQSYEWGQLGSTVLQVVILSFAAMFGLNMNVTAATGIGILGSFGLSAIKKAGTKPVVKTVTVEAKKKRVVKKKPVAPV